MTLAALLLGTLIIGGGGYALLQIKNIFQLLIGHLGYIVIGAITIGAIGYFIVQAYRDNIPQDQVYAPVIIIAALGFLGMGAGAMMGEYLESYTATVEVSVSQPPIGTKAPKLETVSVNNIEKKSPGVFSIVQNRKACIALCDGWKVKVEIYCGGNKIGTQHVTGKGQQTVSTQVRSLQEGQCKAVATPSDEMRGSKTTTYFNVG